MYKEILPEHTSRKEAFELWMNAPNPMITMIKKMDVTPLVKYARRII